MRSQLITFLLVVSTWLCGASQYSRAEDFSEYQIKAAFLYKFADYVGWPEDSLAVGSDLNLCIIGPDPFGRAIDDIAAGERVAGHPLVLKRLSQFVGDANCQIAFLTVSRPQDLAAALRLGAAKHSLTVTDNAAGDSRGVINFVIKDKKVRFEIDDRLAGASDLAISSKLLNLAVSVRSRSDGEPK